MIGCSAPVDVLADLCSVRRLRLKPDVTNSDGEPAELVSGRGEPRRGEGQLSVMCDGLDDLVDRGIVGGYVARVTVGGQCGDAPLDLL
jgi:hypothetical protein